MITRLTVPTVKVLTEFLRSPASWTYGYDLCRATGLKPGSLYPMLMRLSASGLLEAQWETAEPGKPPRHMYKLTLDGLRYARQAVPSRTRSKRLQPALNRT